MDTGVGAWCVVPWSLVLGPWSLVPGPWSLVLGPWFRKLGTGNSEPGTQLPKNKLSVTVAGLIDVDTSTIYSNNSHGHQHQGTVAVKIPRVPNLFSAQ